MNGTAVSIEIHNKARRSLANKWPLCLRPFILGQCCSSIDLFLFVSYVLVACFSPSGYLTLPSYSGQHVLLVDSRASISIQIHQSSVGDRLITTRNVLPHRAIWLRNEVRRPAGVQTGIDVLHISTSHIISQVGTL